MLRCVYQAYITEQQINMEKKAKLGGQSTFLSKTRGFDENTSVGECPLCALDMILQHCFPMTIYIQGMSGKGVFTAVADGFNIEAQTFYCLSLSLVYTFEAHTNLNRYLIFPHAKPVFRIRFSLMRNRIRGSTSGITGSRTGPRSRSGSDLKSNKFQFFSS